MTRDDLRLLLIGQYSPRLAKPKTTKEQHPMREVLAFPKPVKMEDDDYRRFIRRQPCLVSNTAAEAHHVVPPGGGKTGSKVSDYRTVPLSPKLHREYHRLGRERFEQKYNVDLNLEQIRFLEMFISALREGENLGEK